MPDSHVKQAKEKMEKSLESFKHELGTVRTGRASVGLLDSIEVDAYGQKMKLNQVGTVTAPEARLLVITPWDKSQIPAIEKAILSSPLELTPANDGKVIRIPIPQLTEERRKDLVKLLHKLAEEARVSVRNIRRHIMDEIKEEQKSGELPEDEAHRVSNDVQKVTDEYTDRIDEALKAKEEEVMEV
jgi:ribosome recycling factor